MNIVSSFTHSHVVSHLYDFISSAEHKISISGKLTILEHIDYWQNIIFLFLGGVSL